MLMKRLPGKKVSLLKGWISGGVEVLTRRSFLSRSGLAPATLAGIGLTSSGIVRSQEGIPGPKPHVPLTIRKNVCTHCSVGCTVLAEVQNGIWTGQEPAWESPINRGTHCAKGAAIREIVHSDRRLRYPLKLVNGQWQRMPWQEAINEIGDKMLAVRRQAGADSVYMIGSAKMTNEAAYLFRKFGAFWGTNSIDHQARICHSTTVAGVANTWGYGAQTNSYNDLRNSKTMLHPDGLLQRSLLRVLLQFLNKGRNGLRKHETEFWCFRWAIYIPEDSLKPQQSARLI
jgi:formate dehydrogenase major subunit